jgi:type I restriction enzyme, R subunit
MRKEAKARIKINKLLEESSWHLVDGKAGKANVILEGNTKFDDLGEDFEKTKRGFIDYILLDEKGFPLVVLEAKSEDKDPLDGKEQARRYAQSQNVRFVILSNGNLHYFWDLERGNPTVLSSFPTQESIGHFHSYKPNPQKLSEEDVNDDYIAVTQNPNYHLDPRWEDIKTRADFIEEQGLKFLRSYQLRAVNALQESARKGKDRYLFEMATGTGKTLLSAALIKLFIRTGNAKRVLFLVDRLELEDQAYKNFVKYLKNDLTCVIYKENRDEWHKAEIVVSTVQSLSFNNKYRKLFSPTDFDLIISDEAHRSIGGNSRAVFEYFIGYKLGLTATPKDYLKNIDPKKVNEKDPREWERRQLMDTYTTFGCSSGEPTFRYSLIDGVKDGFLVNPVVIDARTEISTQLLSDKGYAVVTEDEDGEKTEEIFTHKDFEKTLFSEKTNQVFCNTFISNALKDPISNEVGKSIVFCISQKHASKITQMLNQFAEQYFPGKYNSDFAIQVTSNIPGSQQFSINFSDKSNNLNGHTRFLQGYKSCKTRVCVTVGMMTTGYDCQDILNIALMRPIFSPTDFIQIKGRGTRKYSFKYSARESGYEEDIRREKDMFKLFDFFANCEYFEEKFKYDEQIKLPPLGPIGPGGDGPPQPPGYREPLEITDPDKLKLFIETPIGFEGMKIDRKFFEKFEETVKNDKSAKEKYEQGDVSGAEEYVKNEIFDKPEEYFNLDKLRKALKADRRITLHEILDKIFGKIASFKTKDELLEEEIEKFISIYKPENKYILPIRNYIKAYISDPGIRAIIESKEYPKLADNPMLSQQDLKALNGWRDIVPEYVKDYVSINNFM